MSQFTPALSVPSVPQDKPPVSHETIDATGCGDAMKRALHLVLDGVPYREAATEAGLRSHQDVYRKARELGLAEVYSAQLVASCRRIADLANHELERRLVEDPGSIPTKDVAVVSGISMDKVAKYEGWDRNHNSSNLAGQVVDRLAALEGKVSLEVTIEHTKKK